MTRDRTAATADAAGPATGAHPERTDASPSPSLPPGRIPVRRLAAGVAGYAAVRALGLLALLLYGQARHRSMMFRLGSAWDAGWYVRIVHTGYTVSNGLIGKDGIPYSPRAFFPLFPALAEPLHRLLPLTAGGALVLVATVAGLVAAAGVYACGAYCHGHRAGVVAAVLWGVLPLAAIENMAYSESLFTAFAAWTLYAALTRRWLTAGALSVLAGLTRPTAMVLTAAVAVAAATELARCRRDGDGDTPWWRPLVAVLLAPLGWVGYMLWTGWKVGSWTGYFHIQDAWGSSFDGGASAVRRLLHLIAGTPTHPAAATPLTGAAQHTPHIAAAVSALTTVVMAVTLLACLALFVLAVRGRQPLVLLVYSGALLVLDLGNSSSSPPLARFLLPAFPLLFPLAARLAGHRPHPRRLPNAVPTAVLPTAVLGGSALLSALYGIVVVFLAAAPS
ncbi:hypothetical protein [Streptacidiphilus cavernicola]|uniref:Glycosyltransferase RgtA/B/C/D-like domain-containing protein n=1 Tax=Streptacidiphilus cavernicola TaxID=3342716 RepID=A0ABV6VXZ9_9ACTN